MKIEKKTRLIDHLFDNFPIIGHLGRNFLEYYFQFVKNCMYETFFVCLYGIGEPWYKISQKFAEYIGVKKIVKIGKVKFLDDFPFFVQIARILFPMGFNL